MKTFITDDFLLQNDQASRLYHDYAKDLPIIDFHNHLDPKDIEANVHYENITRASLSNDQLKWRLLRTMGVEEDYISGEADDFDKFLQWARVVPSLIRHPMYHWTHLELLRIFGIDTLLDESSSYDIYQETIKQLAEPEFSVDGILRRMKVEVICTPNDPADNLEIYDSIQLEEPALKILPAWRPEKLFAIEHTMAFNDYIDRLGKAADIKIVSLDDLEHALRNRHDHFAANGCVLADHYLDTFYSTNYKKEEIQAIFAHSRLRKPLSWDEVFAFRSYIMRKTAELNYEKNWVQQYHYGALRNTNTRMYDQVGKNQGFDAMGDKPVSENLVSFLDALDKKGHLTRTILYNLNAADNGVVASVAGSFNDGSIKAKVLFGSAWRFNNYKSGMERQINDISGYGLLSTMVATQTDAHGALSFTRHEYFRRILCNLIGRDMEQGELPSDFDHIGKIVQDICYYNTKEYFKF